MPSLLFPPGMTTDTPPVSDQPRWFDGYNIRFRLGHLETIGLRAKLLDHLSAQIQLPASTGLYRSLFTSPSTTTGQILAGSTDKLALIQYDAANSTPGTGTRWETFDITPSPLGVASDTVTNPSAGRVEIPPAWWFADQDDVIVGSRANVTNEPTYYWDRNSSNIAVPLTNSPLGAVGGCIVNRILVLLGATSFTDPDPNRYMVIRWSDRFNFEDWTPTDINLSGELLLEGGSRIVGGGQTSFGVTVWTDKRMAVLVETGDIYTVFGRRYIDGGRGLLANRAWCEANGSVWWYDEYRTLNVYDGGRPQQIPNPLKYSTIENITDVDAARVYLVPNPEYGEIVLYYPSPAGSNEVDRQLVYNYMHDAWSEWRKVYTHQTPRFGVIPALAVDQTGNVWRDDIDTTTFDAADVETFSFAAYSNLLTQPDLTTQAYALKRIVADNLVQQPQNLTSADTLRVTSRAYGEPHLTATYTDDWQDITAGGIQDLDVRVGGKAMQLRFVGTDIKSVWRLNQIFYTAGGEGER